jgi:putative membrane protein insertion efficiency factor
VTRLLLALLRFYTLAVSPLAHALGAGGCRFTPTCSGYAAEAVALHGPARGLWLALRRLLRCHPFARGGFDPVPRPPADAETRPARYHRRRHPGPAPRRPRGRPDCGNPTIR